MNFRLDHPKKDLEVGRRFFWGTLKAVFIRAARTTGGHVRDCGRTCTCARKKILSERTVWAIALDFLLVCLSCLPKLFALVVCPSCLP